MHNLDDRHCREGVLYLYLYNYVIKAVVTLNTSINIWVGNSMLLWAKHTWKCAISPSVSLGKKNKRCLFLSPPCSRNDCYQSVCKAHLPGEILTFVKWCPSRFSSRWWYRNCLFLVHLLLLRETRPVLDLCCKCSWRSQSTVWMLLILSLLPVKL